MAQAKPISVVVGSTTLEFVPAQTQNGKNTSLFTKKSAGGVLEFADVFTHNVTAGPQNRNVKVTLNQKSIQKVDGIDMVSHVQGAELKLSFPKNSNDAERTQFVNTLIAMLTKVSADLVSTEVYY